MSNLSEVSQWESGIYQFETSDPVEGGPDGIDNVQARQLGNRTRYLKDQLDGHLAAANPHPQYATIVQMQDALNALVAAAPGALDTLKELADALGDEPNFATTMTNALALKAALDSPTFLGLPKCPTPSRFDKSQLLVNSGWVRDAGLFVSNVVSMQANGAIPLSSVGALVIFSSTTSAVTLPSAASVPVGAAMKLFNTTSNGGTVTVSAAAGDTIFWGTGAVSSYPHAQSETALLVSNGSNQWIIAGGSMALAKSSSLFASSSAGNGYQKLPSGNMLQWGTCTTTGGGATSVMFPIAFPNTPSSVALGLMSGSPVNAELGYSGVSKTGMNVYTNAAGGGVQLATVTYIAVGA